MDENCYCSEANKDICVRLFTEFVNELTNYITKNGGKLLKNRFVKDILPSKVIPNPFEEEGYVIQPYLFFMKE